MNNMRIIAKNIIDDAAIAASPAMTFPETNLALPTERGRVARSSGLSSQQITLSWAANQKAMAIAALRHNLTTSATLRSVWSNSVPATLYDSTALAAFSAAGLDTDITDYTSLDFRGKKSTVQYFSELTTVRSAVLTLADGSNPDGYLEVTRLIAGRYFELTYNPESVELTTGDSSIAGRADDGSHIVDKGYKMRTITVSLAAIPNATDLKTLFAIADHLGKDGECFIDLYPHDTAAMGIYGRGAFRLVDSPTFNHAQYGVHKNTMRFEET